MYTLDEDRFHSRLKFLILGQDVYVKDIHANLNHVTMKVSISVFVFDLHSETLGCEYTVMHRNSVRGHLNEYS